VITHYALELAEARGAELRRQASHARLAAVAACCRPSTRARATRRAVDAVTRLRRDAHRSVSAACCATA
jgi:hypothetical protein